MEISPERPEEKNDRDNGLSPNTLDSRSPLKEEKERLIEAHLARKKVEEDAMLLSNRIALLEAEDRKINKKIEETRKKALEIRDLKIRNKDTDQMKKEFQQQKQQELEDRKKQIKEFQDNRNKNISNSKNQLLSKIKADVDGMKKTKKETKDLANQINDDTLKKNVETITTIKNNEKELEKKKQRQMEDKVGQARRNYEDRIQEEHNLKSKKEEELKALEKREMELIEKIQNTQNIQREAFEELETILNTKPQDLPDDRPIKSKLNSSGEFKPQSSGEKKLGSSGEKKLNASGERKQNASPDPKLQSSGEKK